MSTYDPFHPLPTSYAEVLRVCGDPAEFAGVDGSIDPMAWEMCLGLVLVPFPAPIPLAWNRSVVAHGVRLHPIAAPRFASSFRTLQAEGLWQPPIIRTLGGGYCFRPQRNSTKLSLHAFGLALDLNPDTNPQGQRGDMSPAVVQVFEAHGLTWGGRWGGDRIDGMHIQAASGC